MNHQDLINGNLYRHVGVGYGSKCVVIYLRDIKKFDGWSYVFLNLRTNEIRAFDLYYIVDDIS